MNTELDTLLLEDSVEAIYTKGERSVHIYQLLSVLMGGNKEEALEKSKRLMASVGHDIRELAKLSVSAIQQNAGTTKIKASAIVAALELGSRRLISDLQDRPKISGSRDAHNCMMGIFDDLSHEEFWILLVNKANEVIGRERISVGGTAGTVVDIKIVMRIAIEKRAAALIAFHNHPSGNLQPSQADNDLTKRLKNAAEVLDLKLLDHLIVSERGYYSYADEGMI